MATGNIVERKRKNGKVFEITVEGETDPLTGKRNRVYKTVKGSKKEANTVMRQMIADMDRGIALRKSPKNISEWLDEWIALYLPNVEETTRIGYKTKIRCYIKPAIGDILVQSLRAGHVQKMVNDMLAKGLSPKNIRDTYNNINAAMKKAVSLRMIPYNPCEGVVLPKLKRYKAKVYDINMIHTLLDTAKGTEMYLPIMLCVLLGLRRGELLALRWENVDFERMTITIDRQLQKNKEGYFFCTPKNGTTRSFAVAPVVMEALKKEKEKQENLRSLLGEEWNNEHNLVFTTDYGKNLVRRTVVKHYKKVLERAGLPDNRFHDLRHSFAVNSLAVGDNIKNVQSNLGHATSAFTMDVYCHVSQAMARESAAKTQKFYESVKPA